MGSKSAWTFLFFTAFLNLRQLSVYSKEFHDYPIQNYRKYPQNRRYYAPDGNRESMNWNYEKYDDRADQFHPSLSEEEKRKLGAIYGSKFASQHYKDFENVMRMRRSEIPERDVPWSSNRINELDPNTANNAQLRAIGESYSQERNPMIPHPVNIPPPNMEPLVVQIQNGHCNIHGVWHSAVAGVAIDLIPIMQSGRIDIKTKIFNLHDSLAKKKGILGTNWSGSGMITSESPTTMTIVFQENKSQVDDNGITGGGPNFVPKTAVFVGQCLVCENSPVLQGTWIVFPSSQKCLNNAATNMQNKTPDTLRLYYRQ